MFRSIHLVYLCSTLFDFCQCDKFYIPTNFGVIDKYAFEDEYRGLLEEVQVHERFKRSSGMFYETGKTLALKTSLTLDQLLGPHYSKRVRPNFGGKQVKVKLNLSIRSMVMAPK